MDGTHGQDRGALSSGNVPTVPLLTSRQVSDQRLLTVVTSGESQPLHLPSDGSDTVTGPAKSLAAAVLPVLGCGHLRTCEIRPGVCELCLLTAANRALDVAFDGTDHCGGVL